LIFGFSTQSQAQLNWILPPDNLSSTGRDADGPQAAIDSNGNATAIWSRSDGLNFIIQASTKPFGGSWQLILDDLSETGQNATIPQIAINPNGIAIVVWRRSDGSNNIIQAVSGSFQPNAPTDFMGIVVKNKFLTQTDIINKLSWEPSSDVTVVGYRIYQAGAVVVEVPASGPFEIVLYNRVKGQLNVYTLVSVNVSGIESEPLV